MGCFRVLLALVLLVLVAGFGLCGLFLTASHSADDHLFGLLFIVIAVGAIVIAFKQFSGGSGRPPPRDRTPRE